MESVLVVSSADKGTAFFTDTLTAAAVEQIVALQTSGEARRLLMERDFDLVIINAPLIDESGERLARDVAIKGISQVILVVKSEYFDEVSAACESDGVLTVSKPINRTIFWSALMFAKSAGNRIKQMQAENERLKLKIDEIRIVDRAKCILISHMHMSEQDAHRYIEKQAMDMRMTRKSVAEGIIKTYEY